MAVHEGTHPAWMHKELMDERLRSEQPKRQTTHSHASL